MTDDQTPPQTWAAACAKCGEGAPGPGGILCPPCLDAIASADPYGQDVPAVTAEPGKASRT